MNINSFLELADEIRELKRKLEVARDFRVNITAFLAGRQLREGNLTFAPNDVVEIAKLVEDKVIGLAYSSSDITAVALTEDGGYKPLTKEILDSLTK